VGKNECPQMTSPWVCLDWQQNIEPFDRDVEWNRLNWCHSYSKGFCDRQKCDLLHLSLGNSKNKMVNPLRRMNSNVRINQLYAFVNITREKALQRISNNREKLPFFHFCA
jgi:hypothetical protein